MKLLVFTWILGVCWAQYNPNTKPGTTSIVHLFEWRWADIAEECERFLAPNGFGGVQVRDCRLVSLLDLALEKDYVRGRIAEYMNSLIDIGVAGFRVDGCKHMWPGDLRVVFDKLKNLNTKWFAENTRPFIFQEVIDLGGEPITARDYFGLGRVTEFKNSAKLGTVFRKWDNEKMAYLKNWGEGWSLMPSDKAVVFIDNHDNQRGHGPGGASVLTFWDSRLYKMATGFMLAHPYGVTRVMSSFRWPRNIVNGKQYQVLHAPDSDTSSDDKVNLSSGSGIETDSETESDSNEFESDASVWVSIECSSTKSALPSLIFVELPGIKVNVDNQDPLTYLKLFLDDDLIERIVVESNRYAEQCWVNDHKPK
ncbi:AMY1 amylase, partial [Polypterus senegalus]